MIEFIHFKYKQTKKMCQYNTKPHATINHAIIIKIHPNLIYNCNFNPNFPFKLLNTFWIKSTMGYIKIISNSTSL